MANGVEPAKKVDVRSALRKRLEWNEDVLEYLPEVSSARVFYCFAESMFVRLLQLFRRRLILSQPFLIQPK